MDSKTIAIGPELDPSLRQTLRDVLDGMGAEGPEGWWTVSGAADDDAVEVTVKGETLTIEAPTYVGLTVSGESSLVEEVAAMVAARRTSFEL